MASLNGSGPTSDSFALDEFTGYWEAQIDPGAPTGTYWAMLLNTGALPPDGVLPVTPPGGPIPDGGLLDSLEFDHTGPGVTAGSCDGAYGTIGITSLPFGGCTIVISKTGPLVLTKLTNGLARDMVRVR